MRPLPLLLLQVVSALSPAAAQTVLGLSGTVLTPSADTYELGGFLVGAQYRSFGYGDRTFDGMPLQLLMGLGDRLELGFSFPGVGGQSATPDSYDDLSQLGVKVRLWGANGDPLRLAAGLLFQREVDVDSAGLRDFRSHSGLQAVASLRRGEWDCHGALSASLRGDGRLGRLQFGLGADRPLAKRLLFRGDLAAAWKRRTPSVEALASLGVELFQNVEMRLGGGVGLGRDDFDWQALVGLTLSSTYHEPASRRKTPELLAPPDLSLVDPSPKSGKGSGLEDEEDGGGAGLALEPSTGGGDGLGDPRWRGELELSQRLFFDFGSWQLGPFEQPALNSAIGTLQDLGGTTHIQVVGNTDQVGEARDNLQWGMSRALHVAGQLHRRSTLPSDRLLIQSCGETSLSDTRLDASAGQLNRRVVLRTWNQFTESRRQAQETGAVEDLMRAGAGLDGDSLIVGSGLLSPRERSRLLEAAARLTPDGGDSRLLVEIRQEEEGSLHGYRKLAQLWRLLMQQSAVDPARVYLRVAGKPAARDSLPRAEVLPQLIFGPLEHKNGRLSLSVAVEGAPPSLEARGLRVQLVADVGESRFTSSGRIIPLHEVPDPSGGVPLSTPGRPLTLGLPLPAAALPRAAVSVLLYGVDGTLLQRIPWYDKKQEAEWDDQVSRALGLADRAPLAGLPVMLMRLEPPR